MPLSDYLVGLAFLAGTAGAVGVATQILLRRRYSGVSGTPRVLAWFVVFVSGLIAVHVVPAALTVLSRPAVLAAALLLLAGVLRVPPSGPAAAPGAPAPAPPATDGLSWTVAGTALVVLAAYLVTSLNDTATSAINHIDALSFTLPGVVSWIQDGNVWHNNVLIPGFPVGTYPNNGDALFLATMLPFDSDALVRPVTYLLVVVTGLGVYALAHELGAPRSSSVLFAVLPLTIRVLMVPAVENGKPDIFMLACFMPALVFLVRYARTRSGADLVIGGLALGLAFGARWYGVLFGPVVMAVWAVAMRLDRERWGWIARRFVAIGALMLAGGGFWLVRNWVVTGNPLFPVKIEAFGTTVFDAGSDPIRDKYGFSVLHYVGNWHVLSDFVWPDWKKAFGSPGGLVGLGLFAAMGAALLGRRRAGRFDRQEATVLILAALALLLVFVYVGIPATAQGYANAPFRGLVGGNSRYAVPAFLIAAALTAWLCGRIGRARIALELVALAAMCEGLGRSFNIPESRALSVGGRVAIAAALAAGGWWLITRRTQVPQRMAVTGVALLAALAVVVAGYRDQDSFAGRRYRGIDPVTDVLNGQPEGTRVGIVGDWIPGFVPILPAYGRRFGSRVHYVGYFDRGQLRKYRTRRAFQAALRDADEDLLLVGRGVPPRATVRWERWARQMGYSDYVRSDNFTLLRAPS
jgi:dolichyl-phosphate-mannose-protein mannosyltransferase